MPDQEICKIYEDRIAAVKVVVDQFIQFQSGIHGPPLIMRIKPDIQLFHIPQFFEPGIDLKQSVFIIVSVHQAVQMLVHPGFGIIPDNGTV